MSLLATLLAPIRRSLENPTTPLSDPDGWVYDAFGAREASSGMSINRKTALTYAAFWRGVSQISRDIGKLPFGISKYNGKSRSPDTRHPAYPLLKRKPNPMMTSNVFRQTLQSHAITEGNGYAWINRDGAARPIEMIPLNPEATWPVREHVPGEAPRLLYVTTVDGVQYKLLPESVLHIKGLGFDGLTGYRLLSLAKDSLGLGLAAREYGSRFFRNDARPSVVIEVPGTMTPEDQALLRKQWNELHQGVHASHRAAILTNGGKLNAFSSTARDSQLIEIRQLEIREVANWLSIPAHKLGDTARAGYNSLEQENQSYLDDGLDPWMVTWEEECEDKLLTEEEKQTESHEIRFDRLGLVRANLQARGIFYVQMAQNRIMNPNEIRDREGLNPYEGGDEFMMPANMIVGDGSTLDADPTNDVPPEPNPLPAPADEQKSLPAPISRALTDAHRHLLVTETRRMVKRIATTAIRAAKKPDGFMDWIAAGLEGEHRSVVAEALAGPMDAHAAASGRPVDGAGIVEMLLGSIKRDLAATTDSKPAELAAAVERWAAGAERTLPAAVADRVMNI